MSGSPVEREAAWQRTWDRLIAPVPDEDERKIAAVERKTRGMVLPPGVTMRDLALVLLFRLDAEEAGLTDEQEITALIWAALDLCDREEAPR